MDHESSVARASLNWGVIRTRSEALRLLRWAVGGLFVAALLPRLLMFAQVALSLISWPWQFDYDEGINLHATVEIASGHNIYRMNSPENFISAPYPPLYYLLNAPFVLLAGPSLQSGRIISAVASLAIALLLVYIVYRLTSSWAGGLVAGALWLALWHVMLWSALYKHDMLSLALGLGGLAWTLTYHHGRGVYIAVFLFMLAFYTKQSALTAAAAASLWLLLNDRKLGVRFILLLLAALAIPFAAGNLLLKGGLYEHLISSHVLPWDQANFSKLLGRLVGEYWPLLLWAVGGIALCLWVSRTAILRRRVTKDSRGADNPFTLVALYMLVGLASMLVQIGYEGANFNHYLDGLLPVCLLAGSSLGWLLHRLTISTGPVRAYTSTGLLLAGGLLALQITQFQDPRQVYRGPWPNSERGADMQNLSDLVARTPGYIYSEDSTLLLRNGHRVLYDDASTFGPLSELGRWNSSVFTKHLSEGDFTLMLLSHGSGRLPPDALQAFQDNYALKYRSEIDTYVPVPRATPRVSLDCVLSDGEDSVRLLGYRAMGSLEDLGLRSGQLLEVTLYWQVAKKLKHNYASYVHLVSQPGELVAQQDNPSTGAQQPTSDWEPGKIITDTAAFPVPTTASPGRYSIVAGMYRVQEGSIQALPARCEGTEDSGGPIRLFEIGINH